MLGLKNAVLVVACLVLASASAAAGTSADPDRAERWCHRPDGVCCRVVLPARGGRAPWIGATGNVDELTTGGPPGVRAGAPGAEQMQARGKCIEQPDGSWMCSP